jgi:hypothetical protein
VIESVTKKGERKDHQSIAAFWPDAAKSYDMDHILASTSDDAIAAEKGRLFAAQCIAHNPEQRKHVEDALGVEFCRRRWPEAYRPRPFFKRFVDRLTFRTE